MGCVWAVLLRKTRIVLTSFGFPSAILLCALGSTALADTPVQAVALSGASAPGTSNNVTFSQFPRAQTTPTGVPPSISAQGQVNFYGTLNGPGVFAGINDQGLWSGTPGNVSLVARIDNTHIGSPPVVAFG